jgi:hypothetical protein
MSLNAKNGELTYIRKRHFYDPVAVAVLVIGIGLIELLAMII